MLIPKEVFAAGLCTAKEKVRYAIDGVRLERDKNGNTVAISTNGRILFIIRWKEDDYANYPVVSGLEPAPQKDFSTLIQNEDWKAMSKLSVKSNQPNLTNVVLNEKPELEEKDEKGKVVRRILTAGSTDLSRVNKISVEENTDAVFPRWEVIPPNFQSPKDYVEFEFDLDSLLKLLTAFRKISMKPDTQVLFRFKQDTFKRKEGVVVSLPAILTIQNTNFQITGVAMASKQPDPALIPKEDLKKIRREK